MGRLIVIVLVCAGLWAGYWYVGATSLDRALTTWIDERRAEGWVADVGALEVRGFPNRFDTEMRDIDIADPETGVAWSAPFFQILALSYRPTQVIAVWPDTHRFSTPIQSIDIETEQARGSIFLEATPSLELDRSTIVVDEMRLSSSLGWVTSLREGRFATEQVAAKDNAYRIGIDLSGLAPAEEVLRVLDPAMILPRMVENLNLDADILFNAPLDRRALEDKRPQIVSLGLSNLSAVWGDVTFRAAGDIVVDNAGVPEGEFALRAVEWRKVLDMAVASGFLPQKFAPTVEQALDILARTSGNRDTIDTTLSFRRGLMLVGPIPVGRAPRIVIR